MPSVYHIGGFGEWISPVSREGVFCGMRIAEYGKLSTGNLRKIWCRFLLRNEG